MNNIASDTLKIAISGHRNLIDPDSVRKNIALSFQYFKEINQDIIAISALAAGADTIFAQEANKLGIAVRYVLPFALEDYKKDFQPNELIALERLLSKNNQQYEIIAPLADSSKATRNEAYLAVGKRLVDECDILIAVWDGQDAQGKGGTGDVVAYARLVDKPVHIVKGIRESNQPQDEAHNEYSRLDNEAVKYKKRRFIPAWIAGITSVS